MLAVGGLLAVVVIVLIACLNLKRAAIGLTLLAAFTLPWNGWLIFHERPGDILAFLAFAFFVATGVRAKIPQLPWWIGQLALVIILLIILHEVLPTDPHYLAHRVVVSADGTPFYEFQSSLFNGVKFVFAVLIVPAAFAYAVRYERAALYWLAAAFSAGVSLSGLVAFTDGQGLTNLSVHLTHIAFQPTREGGFTKHPNFLAAGCVIALPLVIWLIASSRSRRARWLGIALLPGVLLGTYATGSRGGAACAVLGTAITVVLVPACRRHLVPIAFAGGALALLAFVAVPGFGHNILKATRIVGGGGTGSNVVRAEVGAQGVRDFQHSPIDGVGFQVAAEAQNVYVQELASGGLILFIGMQVFTVGGIWAAYKLRRDDQIASALVASLVIAAVLNYFEADLTDRFFYVPTALVAAMVVAGTERRKEAEAAGLPTPTTIRALPAAAVSMASR